MMARGRLGWAAAMMALGLGCNEPKPPPTTEMASPEGPSASRAGAQEGAEAAAAEAKAKPDTGSDAPEGAAAIPGPVATLHREALQPARANTKLGIPIAVVTLHDVGLERGSFHVLALFPKGEVATWRQTPGKPADQMFLARLTPPKLAKAKKHITSWAASPGATALPSEGNVMGVSARGAEAVVTRYFEDGALPSDVSHWVAMLKQRLEATNSRR